MPNGTRLWRILTVLDRLFAAALYTYPKSFRERFGAEMRFVFLERSRTELREGRLGPLLSWWFQSFAHLLATALLERTASSRLDLHSSMVLLVRRPQSLLLQMLTLTACLATCAIAAGILDQLVIRPYPYRDLETLVKFQNRSEDFGGDYRISHEELTRWRDMDALFAGIGLYKGSRAALTREERGREAVTQYAVSQNMFPLLGSGPIRGRSFIADDFSASASDVAVIGYRFWREAYGRDTSILGNKLQLGDRPRTIVGVMPEGFWAGADVFVPLVPAQLGLELGSERNLCAWARLRNGVSVAEVQAALDDLSSTGGGRQVRVIRPSERQSRYFGARVGLPLAFALLVVALGLSAWAGLLGLLGGTHSGSGVAVKQKERMPRSYALIVCAFASVFGIAIAHLGIAWFAGTEAAKISPRTMSLGMSWSAATITVVAAILFGIGSSRWRVGKTVIVAAVSISTALTVWAGLLGLRSWAMASMDPGFDSDGVITVQARPASNAQIDANWLAGVEQNLLSRVSAWPEVQSIGLTDSLPLASPCRPHKVRRAIDQGDVPPRTANLQAVSALYFRTIGIPIRRGRTFSEGNEDGAGVIISDALAVELFEEGSPLGQEILLSSDPAGQLHKAAKRIVVGVAANVRHSLRSDQGSSTPTVYVPYSESKLNAIQMVVNTDGDLEGIGVRIRQEVASLDPEGRLTADVRSLVRSRLSLVQRQSFGTILLSLLGFVSLFLTAVGLVASAPVQRSGGPGGVWRRRLLLAWAAGSAAGLLSAFVLGSQSAMGITPSVRSVLRLHYGVAVIDPLAAAAVVAFSAVWFLVLPEMAKRTLLRGLAATNPTE